MHPDKCMDPTDPLEQRARNVMIITLQKAMDELLLTVNDGDDQE